MNKIKDKPQLGPILTLNHKWTQSLKGEIGPNVSLFDFLLGLSVCLGFFFLVVLISGIFSYRLPFSTEPLLRERERERERNMAGGHGAGTTYKGITVHQPKRWHSITGKGMCAVMWSVQCLTFISSFQFLFFY